MAGSATQTSFADVRRFGSQRLDAIIIEEDRLLQKFFGQKFNLSEFKETLKKYRIEEIYFWQSLGLEPHYLPRVEMSEKASFPGWRIRLGKWFYEQVAAKSIVIPSSFDNTILVDEEAFWLKGVTVLIDTRVKPTWQSRGDQMFKNDNLLGPIIERLRKDKKIADYHYGPSSSRFWVSPIEWEEQIKPALAELLKVEVSPVRSERVIEANVIPQIYYKLPRREDAKSNTWVWYEDCFDTPFQRLWGSVGSKEGIHSYLDYGWFYESWSDRAIRPIVVL